METAQKFEVKIIGWVHVCVLAAILIFSSVINRGEIRIIGMQSRMANEQTRKELEEMRRQIQSSQQQQRQWCLQYEQDMDQVFRTKPQFWKHPGLCDPIR